MEVKSAIMAKAHSKLILVGEHSVVYGQPAIAIPFPLEVRVTIRGIEGPIYIQSDLYTGPILQIPSRMKGLSILIEKVLNQLENATKDLKIEIDSDIPLGKGLGSSAAIAMAIARSLFLYFGKTISEEGLFTLVQEAETYAHGKSSGIDVVTVSGKTPIWFQPGHGIKTITLKGPLHIAVGDTGMVGNTREAVEKVRHFYKEQPIQAQKILKTMGRITKSAQEALRIGDRNKLGSLMNENHKALSQLGVSNDEIDGLVHQALKQKALGAKLTGGGLGGCVIALADSVESAKEIAIGLKEEGATMSWCFSTHHNHIELIKV